MPLRGQKPEAIQLLPIYKGRKWVEYKSPKCPILVTKLSALLHFLSNFKSRVDFSQPIKIYGRLKSTLPAAKP